MKKHQIYKYTYDILRTKLKVVVIIFRRSSKEGSIIEDSRVENQVLLKSYITTLNKMITCGLILTDTLHPIITLINITIIHLHQHTLHNNRTMPGLQTILLIPILSILILLQKTIGKTTFLPTIHRSIQLKAITDTINF